MADLVSMTVFRLAHLPRVPKAPVAKLEVRFADIIMN